MHDTKDMIGVDIAGFRVVARANSIDTRPGAAWWVKCPICKARFRRNGNKLRRDIRKNRAPVCTLCCPAVSSDAT